MGSAHSTLLYHTDVRWLPFAALDKIESMIKKMTFGNLALKDQPEAFDNLYNFLSQNKLRLSPEIKQQIVEHFIDLKSTFRKYFAESGNGHNWI